MSKLFIFFLFLILLSCSKDDVLKFNQCEQLKIGYNLLDNEFEDIIIEINFSKKILKETRINSERNLRRNKEQFKNLLSEEQLKEKIKKKEEEIYSIKSFNNGIVEAISTFFLPSPTNPPGKKFERNILFNIKEKKYEYSSNLTNIKSQFYCKKK